MYSVQFSDVFVCSGVVQMSPLCSYGTLSSPPKKTPYLLAVHLQSLFLSPQQPLLSFISLNLPVLDISYQWNQSV